MKKQNNMEGGLKYLGMLVVAVMMSFYANAETADEYYVRLKTERVVSEKTIVWDQVGPGNAGFANFLRYHPTLPGIEATCPDMWNAYQSENNGDSWYYRLRW